MRYYEVFVTDNSYQKREPLTYSYETVIPEGAVVMVPFGRKVVSGFVAKEAPEPSFKTKPINSVLTDIPLPKELVQLHKWLMDYYPAASGAVTQAFVPSGLQVKPRQAKLAKKKKVSVEIPVPTAQQEAVLGEINSSTKKTFLLHGETGSGKTRVYFELARQALAGKQSALILVPEISLVPQVAGIFNSYFDDQVVILHSGLTRATRNKNWLKILNSDQPLIVIGTRSALFAPLPNIGVIVVDEMHEPAYKQESAPRYYGLRAAAQLARLHQAKIVYGSATPPVVEYFMAERTATPILRMSDTARKSSKIAGSIVDLKNTQLFSRHRYLSDQMLAAIEKRLQNHEQSLIFLNRRGSFRTILCQSCGWQAMCPRCDMPLTYHGDKHQLRCHTCGYISAPPLACPECKSDDIVYRSLGTKALVEAIQTFFPEALIRRFDTDNLEDDRLHKHFESVKSGEIDILVGTQMLGKGLDLPKLSLVGVVNADTSLGMPDFSSTERSYQLMHQAIGRVGRGHLDGEVIIQSFHPENPSLIAALERDWLKLYRQEILERETFGFPPFYFLLKITVSRKSAESAEEYIAKLKSVLTHSGLKLKIDDPTPSFYEKSRGLHNWQLIVRARDRGELVKAIGLLPSGNYIYDLDPINLL